MSIRINKEKCIGCTKCSKICPGNLISMKENKAYIKYPHMCWGCASCLKECSVSAIEYFLGEDIGGAGGYLYVKNGKNKIDWYIYDSKGSLHIITTNKSKSNKY